MASIDWQSAYLLTTLLTALMIVALGVHAWRFRRWATGSSFVALAVCGLGWTIGVLLMCLSPPDHAPVWMNLKSLFIHLSVIAVLFYVLEVTGNTWRWRRHLLLGLLVIPLTAQAMLWLHGTPDGWMFLELSFARTNALTHVERVVFGPAYWASSAQGYGISILCIGLLITAAYRAGPLMKKQAFLLAVGLCAPVVANAMLVTQLVPRIYDPMPFGVAAMSLAMWWAVIRHHIVDLVPIARNILVDAMDDAVLAIDGKGRVVDANASMQQLLGVRDHKLLGMSVESIVPRTGTPPSGLTDFLKTRRLFESAESADLAPAAASPVVVGDRSFMPRVIALPARKNAQAWRLLVLHDVTEQLKAEAAREASLAELTEALAQVRTLRGLLPMCASCKNIKDSAGQWRPVDEYISTHSEADLTHGVCPACERVLYSSYFRSGDPPRLPSDRET